MKNCNVKMKLFCITVFISTIIGCELLHEDIHGNSRESASLLRMGSSVEGRINLPGDQDWFRMQFQEHGTLTVFSTGNTDTTAELHDESGRLLISDNESSNGSNFHINQVVDTGTYFIQVSSSAIGNYSLQADFVPDPPPSPDLVIQDIRVSPTVALPNQYVEISFYTRNIGSANSAASTDRAYLSSDPIINANDFEFNYNATALSAGSGAHVVANTQVPSTPGTYYYGACIDTVENELNTSNNCSPGVLVLIDDHGNERVQSTKITLGVSVHGSLEHAEIDGQDWFNIQITEKGTLTVYTTGNTNTAAVLYKEGVSDHLVEETGGGSNLNFLISQRVDPGTYFIQVHELSNEGGDYTLQADFVPDPPPSPDLVIQNLKVSPTTVLPNQYISISFQPHNVGNANALPSRVSAYRSSDSTITTADIQFSSGTPISNLASGAHNTVSTNPRVPLTPGTYYYGACIDTVENELNTSNNCSSGVLITVMDPGDDHGNNKLDSTRITAGVSVQGSIEKAQDQDWFSIEITNAGTLTVYTTGNTNTSGVLHKEGSSEALATETGGRNNFRINQVVGIGTYFIQVSSSALGEYSLQADFVPDSLPSPDLVIQNISVSPTEILPRQYIVINFYPYNVGNANAATSRVKVYRSSDPIISADDFEFNYTVSTLSAGAGNHIVVNPQVPSTPGTYYYGACINTVENESNTSNNCSSGVLVTVMDPGDDHGNNKLDSTRITAGIPVQGSIEKARDQDWFSIEVINEDTLTLYTTGSTKTNGMVYKEGTIGPLASTDMRERGNNFRIDQIVDPGTYFIVVDAVDLRAIGDYVLHAELTPSSDLNLQNIRVSTPTVSIGGNLSISVQAHNIGNGEAPSSTVRFYRSEDSDITINDTELATANSSVLSGGTNSGDISSGSIDTSTAGQYYFGACIDSVDNERTEKTFNNCSQGILVTIESGGGRFREDAYPLVLGSPAHASIDAGIDEDWFSITLNTAGVLNLFSTSNIDTFAALYDSEGYRIYENDNYHWRSGDFRINVNVNAGMYYISVTESSKSLIGNYTIQANFTPSLDPRVPTSNRDAARSINVGESLNASLSTEGDYHWYAVRLAEEGSLIMYSEGRLDTQAVLFDGSANELQRNDDSSHGRNFLMRQIVTPGIYYIRVNEFAHNDTGDYTIRTLFTTTPTIISTSDQGDSSAEATTIALGGSVTESINSLGDEDWFSITVAEAGMLFLYSFGTTDVETRVYDSSNNLLQQDDDGGSGRNFFIKEVVTPGTYYIQVNEYRNDSTGDYTIHNHFIQGEGL